MRTVAIGVLLLSVSTIGFGQQSNSSQTTISGCLMSINGTFTLLTPKGERFLLKGDHDTLFSYNGKQVQVKGTLKSTKKTAAKPATFAISDIKKVADFCQ